MVMESPSAQCVGREFVRQYYTLLHEAPDYLHRFYSHNSCFVHGGVEKPGEEQPPVMGQADIHKKIVSLKFRDCHAKIRQVDSQPTVANAVVVQVTGELSNNGLPMRRFMQTFVLAPQSPKKYYVHNDIFRYQDEVFHDLDVENDAVEETVDSEQETAEPAVPEDTVQDPRVTSFYSGDHEAPALSNGNSGAEDRPESPEEKPAAMEEVEEPAPPAPEEPAFEPKYEPPKEEDPEPEPEPQPEQPPQEPQKPFSWAAMASKNSQPGGAAPIPTAPTQAPKPAAPIKPAEMGNTMGDNKPQPQRPRPQRTERPVRDSSRSGMSESDDANRRSISKMYPDTQQLFVGNLQHTINEAELKDFFEQYGKVLEVRINRKSSSNREVPNFGFVVFASPETVNSVLEMRPIHMRDVRLNVEEKKQRGEQTGRPGSGTRGRGGGPGMMRGAMAGGRGGGGRGGGPGGAPRPDRGRGDGGGPRGGFGRPR